MARKILENNKSAAIAWLPARADLTANVNATGSVFSQSEPFLYWPPNHLNPQSTSLEALVSVKSITLVLDARDALLIHAQVPPLSSQKLAQALPNIVEDQVIQDASQLLIALTPSKSKGLRQLALADRGWIESVRSAFERRGIRVDAIVPAQQVVAPKAGHALVVATGNSLMLCANGKAMGWSAGTDPSVRLAALQHLFASMSLDGSAPGLQSPAQTVDAAVDSDDWAQTLRLFANASDLPFDVQRLTRPGSSQVDFLRPAAGKLASQSQTQDWRRWRWPIWLAGACVIAAIGGLNLRWWQIARERDALRQAAEETFRSAFPKAGVLIDPRKQSERLVADLRKQSGQASNDDLAVLLRKMGNGMEGTAPDSLASVEFTSGRLRVKFQPGVADGSAARQQLEQALLRSGLKLKFDNDRDPVATVSLSS
jgi:general secretion pathway protein L